MEEMEFVQSNSMSINQISKGLMKMNHNYLKNSFAPPPCNKITGTEEGVNEHLPHFEEGVL